MSKKFLVMVMAVVMGLFAASSAMAQIQVTLDYPGVAYMNRDANIGSTAGTILNPEGKGDVLIFPYYDVRRLNGKAQDTYFAIINETYLPTCDVDEGISAKIRFREWDKSLEVYDISIWLSCLDVWVGLISQNATRTVAQLWSPDWVIIGDVGNDFILSKALDIRGPAGELIGRPFRPEVIPIPDHRTLYGYFEVIAEERTASKPHKVGGEDRVARTRLDAPNWLMGYAYIVRVEDGVSAGYNATAIANFSVNQGTLYDFPASELPNLLSCEDTIDQVEFELSKYNVYHGYSIEESIAAKWSMILTLPTKHYHFGKSSPFDLRSNTQRYPYTQFFPRGEPFLGAKANSGEPISIWVYDRHENIYIIPPGFESPPIKEEEHVLPYEVNIIGLYKTTSRPVLTNPRDNVGFPTGTFDSGWIWLQFAKHIKRLDANDPDLGIYGGNEKLKAFNHLGNYFELYRGLPVIGLVFQEFANDTVGVGASYGEMLPIFYQVKWGWHVFIPRPPIVIPPPIF